MSRRKGLRHEYAVRDLMRAEGFECDRVPSSGAAEGFKGDIRARKDGHELLVEVKARHREFHRIYGAFDRFAQDGLLGLAIGEGAGGVLVSCARTATQALANSVFYHASEFDGAEYAVRKLLGCQAYVKGCQMLVLHDDHKPYLFLVYR